MKGTSIFAASGEGEEVFILQLNGDSLQLVESLKGHTDTVSLLQFSPDGKWLASASLDCTVRLWDTATWACVHQLTDLYGEIMCLLWHPSSLVLAAGADDAQLAMWNVQKGSLAMYFVGHRGPVTCALWTPDVKKLVSGSNDGCVSVFNPKTGVAELSLTKDLSNDNAGVTAMCFVNSDQCIVGCEDGTIHVVSVRSEKVVSHFEELHEQAIESMCVNDLSTLLLTASCDCKLIVWNVNDFSPRTVFNVKESVIPAIWVGSSVVAAGCSDGVVRVWDGRSERQEPLQEFMGHRRMIFRLALVDDMIVSSSDDGCVKCFKLSLPEV
ncbi:hypothetical protein STCU_01351 [Strigomonas culicis]|nr:hypothetical protein STCU_01351 [Strigomonas culicis]|eukprot:EPY34751.1 hypothetical protein STCU_01351 [Strigomonas culicis]